MTAIFVFVEGSTALIASDTKRAQLGWATSATKTQQWSRNVLVSQTGFGEGLQRLIGEMMLWQHCATEFSGAVGLVKIFKNVGPFRYETEVYHAQSNRSRVNGTLVIAEAARIIGQKASITTIDWASGQVIDHPGPVYADGTDPASFQKIAEGEYRRLRPTGTGAFNAGQWGVECIKRAMQTPQGKEAVDWPIDLAIIRRDDAGHLLCITQKLEFGSTPSSHFNLPAPPEVI
jgi:hypothetical protein